MKLGIREIREDFNKQLPRGVKLTGLEYRAIISAYYKIVIDKIIFENYQYRIPYIGYVSMFKKKGSARLAISELKQTKLAGLSFNKESRPDNDIPRYHENKHTNGFVFLIRLKYNKLVANRYQYRFRPNRYKVNRYLAKILKNPSIYGHVDAFKIL